MTVDGRLYKENSTQPLIDNSVTVQIQILNPTKTCILYEEEQIVSTLSSSGYFNARVGSPTSGAESLKRTTLDSGHSMKEVFQNQNTLITGQTSGGMGCSYTPNPGDTRYFRFIVTPSTTGVTSTLSPDMTVDSVPQSLVAESLQGMSPDDFIQVSANVTQAKAESLFGVSYSSLTSLLAGSSSMYLQNTTNGTVIPSRPSDPASPTPGQIWYDSVTHELKYWDGTVVQAVGSGGGSDPTKLPLAGGTMTGAINMGSYDLTSTGHITQSAQRTMRFGGFTGGQEGTLLATPLTAGQEGTTWYNTSTDQLMYWDGTTAQQVLTVSGANSLVPHCNPNESLEMSAGPTYVWSCVATTDSTKLALTGGSLTGALTMDAQNQMRLADAAGGEYAAIRAPTTIGANYILTLPDTAGSAGQVLTTDGSGVLSWTTTGGAPVTSVFGRTGVVVATAGDYTATQVTNTAAGTIAATTVQAALNELDTEKVPTTRTLGTAADSGLSGGGDLSANRNFVVDIIGTTAETTISGSDEILIYDTSTTALRKMTRANFVLSEAEVDAMVANNGYLTTEADTLDTVTGRGASTANNITLNTQAQMRLGDSAGGEYAAIRAPVTIGTNYVLTLPDTAGSANQVLMTDGTGVLSWIAIPSAPVATVYGRTGAVVATAGDYTGAQVTNTAAGNIAATTTQDAINELDSEKVAKAGDAMTGALTMNAQNQVRFADSDSSNYVGFQSPATVSANRIWTLPAMDGTSGQVLSTDGSGVLSWIAQGSAPVSSVFGRTGAVVATSGDYTGAQVTNTAAGNIAATTIQGAIDELDTEKVPTSRTVGTGANSGLSGGGDLSANRNLVVDITGTTDLGAAVDNADELLIYDVSGSVLRKATRSQFVLSEAEVDVMVSNNGYLTSEADTLDTVTGRGASTANNITMNAQAQMRLGDAAGGEYAAIRAPTTIGANYVLTLPVNTGSAGQYLQTDGTGVLSWVTPSGVGETNTASNVTGSTGVGLFKQKSTFDLEFKSLLPGSNKLSITGGASDVTVDVVEANINHDNLAGFVANEHIDHSTVSIATSATSGLSGGGDLTTTRNLVVNITGTTAETAVAAADELLIYDVSASALRKMTRANFVLSEAEVDAMVSNNGYISSEADTLDTVTGRGSSTANSITMNAQAQIRLADSDSSNYVGFQSPATVTSNRIWTLPAADGTSGQVLSTDGSGVLSWVAQGSAPVSSVFGRTGAVTATAGDYTAAQVTNVAAGNIAATDVQTALNELDTEKVPTSRTLSTAANSGLSGGGDLSANRNFVVDIAGTTAETAAAGADEILIYDVSASALRKMTRANFVLSEAEVDAMVSNNGYLTSEADTLDSVTGRGASTANNITMNAQAQMRLGDAAGEEYAAIRAPTTLGANYVLTLPVNTGSAGQYLQTDGTGVLSWVTPSGVGETNTASNVTGSTGVGLFKQKSTFDLEFKSLLPGSNKLSITGGASDVTVDVVEANINHDNLAGFVANEHIDHSTVSVATSATSGLSGGGDLTTTRNLAVNITGTTAETSVAGADEIMIYDVSASALRKMTRANFVLSEAEVDAMVANNGYLATEADTLDSVTGRGAATANNITMNAQAQMRLADAAGGEYAAIRAPTTIGTNYVLTLPDTAGSANQVLITDGTGVLSWMAIPSAPVSSVYGRTGAVVATAGDYTATQVTNTAAGNVAATTVQSAINELDTEKVDTTRTIGTVANSGLSGGGDLSANRNLVVDITGTTAETSAAGADEILIYDVSASALRKMSRANFVLSEAEVDAMVANNGYLATEADTLDTVTGRGAATANNITMNAQAQMRLADAAGGEYAAIRAPTTIGTNYVLTLPDTAGSANQVLITDGTGVLSWAAIPSAPVSSVYGRTGVVVATAGDYTGTQVTNTAAGNIAATTTQAAINELDTEKVAKAGDTMTGQLTMTNAVMMNAQNQVRFADSDSSNYVGFQSPATVTANRIWTLPATDGASGQILSTDGSGVLSWVNDTNTDAVASVFGRTGVVVATAGDYTGAQVTNTAAGAIAATTVQSAINELDTEKVAKSGDTMTGALTLNAQNEVRYADSDSSNYVAVRSPSTVASNVTLTLPGTAGSANQVLSTDGTGVMSWVAIPSAPVSSVYGRTGAVVATAGDYTATQVTNTAAGNIAATTVQGAINELDTEKVDSTRTIGTAANSGLSGGGDLSANRNLVVDITGTTAETTVAGADEILIYDASATALRKMTRANFVLSEAEVDAMVANNGYLATEADTLDSVTGRGAATANNITMNAQAQMRLADAAGGEYAAIRAPTTIGTNYVLTLPTTAGAANQVLSTDGSGVLSWMAIPSAPVSSVYGRTSAVVATAGDYTAAQVTNTAAGNIAATTTQAAINELDTEKVAKAGDAMTGALTMNAQNQVRFADSDSSNYVGFQSPATVGTNRIWTLPATDGASGQILSTDGSGVLSWVSDTNTDAVSSVFGRTGVVVATAGDYTGTQVTNVAAGNIAATTTQAAINELDTEKVATTRTLSTAANSGLSGGGDLSADRNLAVDITGTTAETVPAGADEILVYDASATALRKMTRANFLSGTLTSEADTLDTVTGRGAATANNITLNTQAQMRLGDAAGGEYAAIRAPTTIGTNYVLTLPDTAGAANQVLTTDGSGVLSWVSIPSAPVASVYGRTGAVVATAGDYTAAQVTNTAAGNIVATTTQAAINELDTEKVAKAGDTMTGQLTMTNAVMMNAQNQVRFADSDSSNYVGFQSPATVSANRIWTLPAADGTSGQILSTDGSGTLSWVSDTNTDAVNSVFGRTGVVVATAGDYTGTQVTNTAAGNIAATTTQAAINELDTEKVAKAGDTMTGALTMNAQNEVRYADSDSSNYVAIRSPGTVSSNVTLTLPGTAGSANQVLATDGAGVLSWMAIPSAPVSSVYGRTGAVVATAGDYTATQVTNTAAGNIAATTVQAALNELDTEKVATTRTITTAANSGLSGGGDLSANRSLAIDITGTTAETVPAGTDEILVYDASATALRKMTRANFLSGTLTSEADTLDTVTGRGAVTANNITLNTQAQMRLGDAAGGEYAAIRAPTTIGTNYVLTLPDTAGSANQVLTTDGSGVLSWVSIPSAPVSSVYGRTGAVVATAGDYTATQVTNTAAGNIVATTTQAAINELDTEKVAKAGDAMVGALTMNAQNQVRFADSDSSNYVGFQSPATVSANRIWTLPAADGTSGQILSTNGSGTLSWVSDTNTDAVNSVFGRTGVVVATAGDYTGAQVTNTAAGTIAATTTQAAINELDTEKVAKAGDAMTGALTMNAQNEVRYADSDSSNYVAVRSPATVTANVTLTLPGTAGSANQVLSTDGAGVLSWMAIPSAPVSSVYGRTGAVVATAGDYTATQVTNTAAGNIVATTTQAAINELDTEKVAKAGDTMTGQLNMTNAVMMNAQNQVRYADSDSSNYAAIQSPTTITANYTLTLPTTAGASGQVLSTNGSGVLSWVNDSNALTSVFGRTGVVVATAGDYTATQITNTAAGNIAAVTAQAAINELDTEKVAKAGDAMTGALTMNAQNEVRYADSDSSNFVAIRSPATVSSNVTLTLPNTVGSANQVLSTDGAGVLSWMAIPSAPVTSVYGRTGVIVATAGDYTATQVTNTAAGNIAAVTAQAAINELDTEKVAKAGDAMTGALTLNAQNQVRFADSDSSNYVGFQSPATVGANRIWTLPAADGTSGQILSTNGSGTLSWVSDTNTDAVSSVFGRTGVVVATAGDYTGTQVTNTAAGNIAATTTQAAINELDTEKVAKAGDTMTGQLTMTNAVMMNAQNAVRYADSDSSNYVAIRSPAIVSSNVTLTLPANAGSANQVLSTDGAGVLSWMAIPSAPVTSVYGRTGVVVATAGDYTATQVTNTAAGNIVATTVQAAINELDTEKVATTRTITTAANSGLSGGGDLSANRSLTVDITGTTAETVVAGADEILIYDTSATALRKMTRTNFLSGTLTSEADTLDTVTGRGAATANNITLNTQAQMRLADSAGGEYAAIRAPTSVTANYVLTLPATAGAANQVLTTDGAGVLSWTTAAAAPVSSVYGRTGAVVATAGDYTGTQITNTAAGNIVATTTQAAINELDTEKVAKAGDTMTGQLTMTNAVMMNAQNQVRYADSDSSNYAAIQSPATITANYTLTLPTTAGASGQVLSTNGSGVLSWVNDSNALTSVFGRTGVVVATAGDYTATQITNTAAGNIVAVTAQAAINELDTEKVAKAGDTMTGQLTMTNAVMMNAQNQVRFADSDSSNYVGFQSPATVSANRIWTLPSADGVSGQVLSTNGAGVLSWVSDANSVSTVFGRSGAVVATAGDYTATQITNTAAGNIAAVTAQAAINELDTEKVAKAGDTMTGNLTINAQNDVRFADTDSSNYVAIQSAGTVGTNYTLTLPTTAGASGQVLSTDGTGLLSWVAIPSAPVSTVFGRSGAVVATAGDYTATQITNTAAGNIAAVTAQAAINELDTEKVAKAGDTMTGALTVPTIYGSSAASGNITIDSTSNGTKGYVLLNPTSGSVGIGTTTPASQTDISSSTGGVLTLSRVDTVATVGESIGAIQFWNNDTQLSTNRIYGSIEVQAANGVTTDAAAGRMIFKTASNVIGSTPQERMQIDASGRVGIGGTPGYDLHVQRSGTSSESMFTASAVDAVSSGFAPYVYLRSYSGTSPFNGAVPGFRFSRARGVQGAESFLTNGDFQGQMMGYVWNGSGFVDTARILFTSSENHTATAAGTEIEFRTVPNGTLTEQVAMTIQNDRNVAMGSGFVAQTRLDVGGAVTSRAYGTATGETGQVVLRELVANGAQAFTIKAPDLLSANRTWVLPDSNGVSGQVLQTDGTGVLSWAANPSAPVSTVFGRSGAVVATAGDYTATQITNTAAGNIAAVTAQAAINELDTEKVAKAGDAMTGALTMNAQNQVRYADSDSSNYAAIQSPATIGTNYTLTLPTTAGASGQVLSTNGSGVLSWVNDSNALTSVFGRTGVVVATAGDYTATQITNTAAGNIAAVTAQAAINELDTEKVAKAGDTMTGQLTMTNAVMMNAQNQVRLGDSDSSNYVAIRSPVTVTANVTLTLPATAGVANQVLSTDGTGLLSWTTPSTVVTAHSGLTGLTSGDDHTQYALLAGRAGGQTLRGGTAASENLTIESTSNATKGNVIIQPTSGNVGIGTLSSSYLLGLSGEGAKTMGMLRRTTTNTAGSNLTVTAGDATLAATDKNGGVLILASGTSTGTGTSSIQLRTSTAALTGTTDNAPTTKMTVTGAGDVGIGTTTPAAKLDIEGTIQIGDSGETCTVAANAGMLRYNGGNLIYCNGSAWVTLSSTGTGSVTTTQILDSTIASIDIAADTIVAADIATGGVGSAEILDNSIVAGDIAADAITASELATGSVTTTEILDSTVASADIAADTIVAADIATGGVATAEILDGTIASADLSTALVNGLWSGDGTSVWRASGNVGIGTTSPATELEVYKSAPIGTTITATNINNGAASYASFNLKNNVGSMGQLYATSSGYTATAWEPNRLTLFASSNADGINFSAAGSPGDIRFLRGSTEYMRLDGSGNLGIGTTTPGRKLEVAGAAYTTGILYVGSDANGNPASNNTIGTILSPNGFIAANATLVPAAQFGKQEDGAIVQFRVAGTVTGTITSTAGVVAYNAFTGAHYALSDQEIMRGELVTMDGDPVYRYVDYGEPFYNVKVSHTKNAQNVLGSMLGVVEPTKSRNMENPYQVMAVGNGDMWVVDKGEDIQVGDYLISSEVPGHAEKDIGEFEIAHVVARVAENVRWKEVSKVINGVKHKKISVTFEQYDRFHAAKKFDQHQRQITSLEQKNKDLEKKVNSLQNENEAIKKWICDKDPKAAVCR